MSVNLKVTLGIVNYTNYIHVTASKVSSPSAIVWEDWIDAPITNLNFVIPGLDPENYYVRYFDAATNVALGTLVLELLVNATTGDIVSERRYYTCGGGGAADPIDGSYGITDTYLAGKNITGCFKEGFRYFVPTTEYTSDDVTGAIDVINGTSFSTGEVFIVELTYKTASLSPALTVNLYVGETTVTTATRTLISADIDARVRCMGAIATQVITLPSLPTISTGKGFYFDNTCGGVAKQVKILTNSADRIRFNGFMAASDLFEEFWVSKGEHVLIKKFDDNYWEVITDYNGVNVGERLTSGYLGMPGTIPENATLYDGDEYPRLWWWINNVLPTTHVITNDTVISAYVHPPNQKGLFVKHSTLKKFRTPNTQGLVDKGLNDFVNYNIDITNGSVERLYNYPGGFEAQMLLLHGHPVQYSREQGGNKDATGSIPLDNTSPIEIHTANTNAPTSVSNVLSTNAVGGSGGAQNRVNNNGTIFLRRI